MKILLILTIILFGAQLTFAQLPGKRIKGGIVLSTGKILQEGDTLVLGIGTMANKNFAYATHGGLIQTGEALDRSFANTEFVIEQIRNFSNPRFGNKIYAVIKAGIGSTLVDLPIALETGEVKAIKPKK